MAIYYYNRCIDQDDADTNEKMESGEQKFYNATAHGRAYVLNAVWRKTADRFPNVSRETGIFYRTLLHGCNLPMHVLE